MENVTTFQYMGRPLDQTVDDWTDVRRNIMRARSVWGILGTLLRQCGEEPRVSEIFYRMVVQAILLYGSETWVLSASMENRVEGTHTEFLRLITGKRSRRLGYGHGRRLVRKAYERQRERSWRGSTYRYGRQPWCIVWGYVPYLRCVQGI